MYIYLSRFPSESFIMYLSIFVPLHILKVLNHSDVCLHMRTHIKQDENSSIIFWLATLYPEQLGLYRKKLTLIDTHPTPRLTQQASKEKQVFWKWNLTICIFINDFLLGIQNIPLHEISGKHWFLMRN